MKKNDIFIFPSRYEGFPLVVLEAFFSGLTCFVSKICKSTEIPNFSSNGEIINSYLSSVWVKKIFCKLRDRITIDVDKNTYSIFNWKEISKEYEKVLFE